MHQQSVSRYRLWFWRWLTSLIGQRGSSEMMDGGSGRGTGAAVDGAEGEGRARGGAVSRVEAAPAAEREEGQGHPAPTGRGCGSGRARREEGMTVRETDLESMSPTELLREQTRLLGEINILIIQAQVAQERVYSQVADLTQLTDTIRKGGILSKVTEVEMSLGAMVAFMVKWTIASIPAAIIVAGLAVLAVFVLGALGVGLGTLARLFGS
jgi:hypothetical protein